MAKASDVYDAVTADIVRALEEGADGSEWRAPWNACRGLPTNAETGNTYQGGNVLALWGATLRKGYAGPYWATYRQWQGLGRLVRRGEKASYGIKWIEPRGRQDGADDDHQRETRRLVPCGFAVFHYDQTDADSMAPASWAPPAAGDGPDPIPHCAAFFEAIGADVSHGSDRAGYSPSADRIVLPDIETFRDAESYYATRAHETTHWSGHKSRLARDLSGRFGDDAYAAEELVAEIGAAFVAARLGIETTPREDHAQYLAHWLRILKADPKAVFAAATAAQRATDFLVGLSDRVAVAA
jgi:antirestriction protein ArdC